MDEKYKALKKELSWLTSIPPDQILFVEIMGPIVKVKPDGSYSFPCFVSVCYGFYDGYWSWFLGLILAYLPTLTYFVGHTEFVFLV